MIKDVMGELELSLNNEKTKVVDAKKEGFDFLGFTTKLVENPKTCRYFPLIEPSKKSTKHIRAKIKALTTRRNLSLPKEVVINKLNEVVRGWTNYFYYQNCSEEFSSLKNYFEERVRIYLRRKHANKHIGYKAYPYEYLYKIMGLYRIPTTAPWKQTAKAYERR
ncbi:MAG: maturase [Candidatus Scalindua sp. AMX11]|nr:maturase [Planctomycetota bacterium]RZV61156.1 MAG: maturase [Candidatus Scalindua sp. SCAELEC01]TDE63183.1 MAG: maturase [Candidatus Scalindua sp. AMX11]GJQ57573.1 MAG: hypothetical protein SCALA701_03740 [Candidatus Scalindua sp.]